MKIDQLTFREYAIPFRRPLVTASTDYRKRQGFIICLVSGSDRDWGEAAPLAGISSDSQDDARRALERFAAVVGGTSADWKIPELVNLIADCTATSPAARFGLETALYSLAARKQGLSLAQYLNAESLKKIRVNALYCQGVPIPPGVNCLKVKIGHGSLENDIRKIEALSKTLEPGVVLRLDVNGKWLPSTARLACRQLARFKIDYLEQPLAASELQELAHLRRDTAIPIAVDESAASVEDVREVIKAGAADVLVLKPTVLGGFAATAEVIRLARESDLRVVLSSALERFTGRLALLHLAAAEQVTEPCGFLTGELLEEKLSGPFPGEDGCLAVPAGTGLNYEGDIC